MDYFYRAVMKFYHPFLEFVMAEVLYGIAA